MGKKASAATPAIAALQAAGIEYRTHEYRHDPRAASYGGEAAEAMGIDPVRVYKTLVIAGASAVTGNRGSGGELAVAMVPVLGRLDLKAAAAALGLHRPTLAAPDDVRRVTGYVLGGVSPLGQRRTLPTAIDVSVLGFETVFCSAGRRGLEIELAPADLIAATTAVTGPLAAPGSLSGAKSRSPT
jgi:Cys-tRNA(Pro)/Cys-tRNA(Cys) deacylase